MEKSGIKASERNLTEIEPSKMLIADMHFSNKIVGTRIINILRNHGIHTLAQLLTHTEQDLLDMRNFGAISLAELTVKLKRMGFELRKEEKW